jgi:hypothetical protein
MKSMRTITIIAILAVTTVACFATGLQSTPSSVLFSDDFSDTRKSWNQVTDSSHTTDYFNGAYRIVVNNKKTDAWATPGKESFIDTRIEVDASKNAGPDDNDFGIICRYTDVDKFYYAIISSDGYYSIMKMTSGNGRFLGRDSMHESDKINQGAATNRIRFDCVGTTLTLYVNGFQIDQQSDLDYTTGNVGLISGALGEGGTDLLFDNFYVLKP